MNYQINDIVICLGYYDEIGIITRLPSPNSWYASWYTVRIFSNKRQYKEVYMGETELKFLAKIANCDDDIGKLISL